MIVRDGPDWFDRLGLERPRAKSLIVTLYGDCLLPRGGQCWLSELIQLVAPLGINERMARTAVFRLVQDGLLHAQRVGRRSRYTLTTEGRRTFDSAQARIYASAPPPPASYWTLVLISKRMSAENQARLRKALYWLGYARLQEGLVGAARSSCQAMAAVSALGLSNQVTVFEATPQTPDTVATLISDSWALDALAAQYETFLSGVRAVIPDDVTTDRDAFELRIVLVHSYRRLLLRDPALPEAQLPEGWPGTKARLQMAALYRRLTPQVERFLDGALSNRVLDKAITAARFP